MLCLQIKLNFTEIENWLITYKLKMMEKIIKINIVIRIPLWVQKLQINKINKGLRKK
jgi:hypothetical protein